MRRTKAPRDTQDAILAAVADGTVLMGTTARLARSLGLSVGAFLAGLRELLEAGRIAVTAEPSGQLTIRLERRRSALPPVIERRNPGSNVRVL